MTMVKNIFILIFALFFISCNTQQKDRLTKKQSFSEGNISVDMYHIKLNDNDRKFTDDTDYIYFYPKVNGHPTDVHILATLGNDKKSGIEKSCGLYYFQGNPMKMDHNYPKFMKEKRLPPRPELGVHKTSYIEHMDILKYVKYLCESKYDVEYIGCVMFEFEDMGELNVEITELFNILKSEKNAEDDGYDFSQIMEKTKLAKDMKKIFSDYDVAFKGPKMYEIPKISYSEYAAKHKFDKSHNIPYVYLLNTHLIRLNKNTSPLN